MKSIHWLICMDDENITDISSSSFASYRLRSALFSSKIFKDFKVTYGENIENIDQLDYLFVGKIYSKRSDLFDKWIHLIKTYKKTNKKVFFDYTDNHLEFDTLAGKFYKNILDKNDHIITSSAYLKFLIQNTFEKINVIEDPIDISPQKIIKMNNNEFLFYGHNTNISYLLKLIPKWEKTKNYTLHVQSSHYGLQIIQQESQYVAKPNNLEIKLELWSIENMLERAKKVSGIIIPGDINDPRKQGVSSNRLITAFALGLPVAASKYDSYLDFDNQFANIDYKNEFETFLKNPTLYSSRVVMAQKKLNSFTKDNIALKWLNLIK
jgi:hypothetical protein